MAVKRRSAPLRKTFGNCEGWFLVDWLLLGFCVVGTPGFEPGVHSPNDESCPAYAQDREAPRSEGEAQEHAAQAGDAPLPRRLNRPFSRPEKRPKAPPGLPRLQEPCSGPGVVLAALVRPESAPCPKKDLLRKPGRLPLPRVTREIRRRPPRLNQPDGAVAARQSG